MVTMKMNFRLIPANRKTISSIEEFQALGGFRGLEKVRNLSSEQVIEEIKKSGLRGRGGAGFPTGLKWETVFKHSCPTKYVCCNGAEGEPGTFKDRYLMRKNPYQVLEGLAIAAHVLGAKKAFMAVKKRFLPEIKQLERALEEMVEKGIVEKQLIEISFGPDDYLFGEEKGLMEVLEGKRALPRQLPPYEEGLFRDASSPNPTLVNNVETLSHVAQILAHGADWFREVGTEKSPGTMLFTFSGDIAKPGIYEAPLGMPFQKLIEDYGGGAVGKEPLRVAFSGAANPVLPKEKFQTPVDFDSMKEAGSGLGSGGFILYNQSACVVRMAYVYSWFLSLESCGQCISCKTGCAEITRCLENLESGHGSSKDLDEIKKQCDLVETGRLCYLAAQENLLVRSVCARYWEEFVSHTKKGCPYSRSQGLGLPKMEDFDESRHQFSYDTKYKGKELIP